MKSIIYICTGNICRSPMAHWYMQKKIKDFGNQNDYLIDSCGTSAQSGQPATKNAIEAISEYDVDMKNHRAKYIDEVNLTNYDLIICLTESHKNIVLYMYPNIKDKIFTLKEYINKDTEYKDIDDPWGFDINVYRTCAEEIVENVDKLIEKF